MNGFLSVMVAVVNSFAQADTSRYNAYANIQLSIAIKNVGIRNSYQSERGRQ